jgi:hypothetical protein
MMTSGFRSVSSLVDYHQLRRVLRAAGIVRVNDGHKGSTRTVLAVGVADRLAVGLRGAK